MIRLYHGSYKKIENFKSEPIWCSNLFDTANNYVLAQSNGESGKFGFVYFIDVDESDICFVEDIDSVDCGDILNGSDGAIFSAENESGDRIFCIRDASKYSFQEHE